MEIKKRGNVEPKREKKTKAFRTFYLFHYGVPYHIETGLLICSASQWTGFWKIGTTAIKESRTKGSIC